MAQIGPIQWGKGFNQSLSYPLDRLARFLNTDPNDEASIVKYCSDFKYLPTHYYVKRSLTKAFAKEQLPLREIAIKAINQQLTSNDINIINKYLPTRKMRVLLTNQTQLANKLPKQVEIEPYTASQRRSNYLLDSYSLSGTLSTLWEDLVRLTLTIQVLKSCANCGKFFTKKNNRLQITCSPECQESRKKRNQRKNQ